MSQLDDLLSRSRSPGRFIERRQFSLSRAKAIEKLREFSLRDPRQYVLELVQAAVFSGASYIAIDVDQERLLLAWVGGTRLLPAEVENVFDYLFADRGKRSQRHLVQLAIGLNALLQRKPKVLRLESGDGTLDGTLRMELDKKGNGVVGKPEDPLAGTYLLAEFGTNWLARFRGETWTQEAALIEERCRFTPVPILLNGRAPFGWKASRRIRAFTDQPYVDFDDGQRRGLVALPSGARSRNFGLVVGGVTITRSALPQLGLMRARDGSGGPIPLTGIICDDNLRKTADQSDIVQDTRFAAMLHAVQPHATQLLRRVSGPGYQPPALPRIAAAPDAPEDAEPVPDPIPQLAPRQDMSLAGLASLPAGTPVFRVRLQDEESVREAADPGRFPHPILVLRDAQIPSLDEVAPGLAVHRLGSPADVDFVRRALERRRRRRSVSLDVHLDESGGVDGRLTMDLTLAGPPPCWGDPSQGDMAVRICAGDLTVWSGMVAADLPGVSVTFTSDATLDGVSPDLAAEIAERARAEAWRLIPPQPTPTEPPPPEGTAEAVLSLARGLLATHVHPHFVRAPEGTHLRLALPARWGAAADQLLDLKVIRTTGGPISARELCAVQGTPAVFELEDTQATEECAVIEDRVGAGHLRAPGTRPLLCAAVRLPLGWEWWGPKDWSLPAATAVVGLSATITPGPAPAGWRSVDAPLGVTVLARDGADVPEDLAEGLKALQRRLRRALTQDLWALGGDERHANQNRTMGRLALLHISAQLGDLGELPILRPSDGGPFTSLAALQNKPAFSLAPRHGPRLAESETVLVSRDELAALEGFAGPLPLRFDDAPEVWRSLVSDDESGWLVRHEVSVPGLQGWLGLRLPFDQTSGVLLQGTGAVVALPELDRALPCHGLLWQTGGRTTPTQQQLDLLTLARQQLYQDLSGLLHDTSRPGAAESARRYASRFARVMVDEAGGRLGGTAADIARQIQVSWPDGREWGTLAAWFAAPASARPRLPDLGPGPLRDRTTVPAPNPAGTEAATADMAIRLARALGWPVGKVQLQTSFDGGTDPVRVDARWSSPTDIMLMLDLDAPLATWAIEGRRGPTEMILLEGARRIAEWTATKGRPVDLLDLQRVLVAQRLASKTQKGSVSAATD
jgi:hypothetical protein